jgi:hypothetical protein
MSHPLTSHTSPRAGQDPARAAELAGLAALRRRDRNDRRARAAMAAGFGLIAAAVAWPILASIPAGALALLALAGLAVAGAAWLITTAWGWLAGRYEVVRPHPWQVWRWRIAARWYAPGSTVWREDPAPWDGPLTVLAWVADPACPVPWALVYDGTPLMSGGAALWLPLTHLAPVPPERPAARRAGGGRS